MPEPNPITAEKNWTAEGVPVLTAKIQLPQLISSPDKVARRIHRYYQAQSRAYLRYCQKWLLPQAEAEYHVSRSNSTPPLCFHAELSGRITYCDDRLLSLYTQSREETLPGQTLITRHGDTWDLTTGYPLPLSAFFPPHTPWKKRLLALAAESIRTQERSGAARYLENWHKMLRRRFNPQNYYLTEDGLTFFFSMYSIAPAFERIPTFTLPFGTDGFSSPPQIYI